MQVLDPGHRYLLDILDSEYTVEGYKLSYSYGVLNFVKREGPNYPGNVGTSPGTIVQDVLRCCIDRIVYVNNQIPHPLNQYTLDVLRDAIYYLEQRAAQIHNASFVLAWKERQIIETFPTGKNGHLLIGAGK